MVAETATAFDPLKATVPTVGEIEADVAFVEVHERVVVPPPAGRLAGLHEKVPVGKATGAGLKAAATQVQLCVPEE